MKPKARELHTPQNKEEDTNFFLKVDDPIYIDKRCVKLLKQE